VSILIQTEERFLLFQRYYFPIFNDKPSITYSENTFILSLRVVQSGLLSTLQDLGREGYRQAGINPTGAMDTCAARLVNSLVGNPAHEGVLEFHFPMGEFIMEEPALLAFGGGDFQLVANQKPIRNWRPYVFPAGTHIRSQGQRIGTRLYMAVQGGFAVESWLDSYSTHLKAHVGGFQGRMLQKGDVLPFRNSIFRNSKTRQPKVIQALPWKVSDFFLDSLYHRPVIQMLVGPEWEWLTKEAKASWASQPFRISTRSDRMGYRLEGPVLNRVEERELVSSAVTKGTVQLLPDGQLIILMADHQTTGGYPRIGQAIMADLTALAQYSASESLHFKFTSLEEAEQEYLTQEKELAILETAARWKMREFAHSFLRTKSGM